MSLSKSYKNKSISVQDAEKKVILTSCWVANNLFKEPEMTNPKQETSYFLLRKKEILKKLMS